MIPDEARRLRPGDYVMAVVRIERNHRDFIRLANQYIDHGNIVEKLRPMPSRKFKVGDIVRYGEALRYVINDQDLFGVLISSDEPAEYGHMVDCQELTLICPVENREDMNAGEPAAAPAELQRGNLSREIGGEA